MVKKFSEDLLKLHATCPEELFEETFFLQKIVISKFIFELCAKNLWTSVEKLSAV